MPNYKKTKATNKKRNLKLQQERERQKLQEQEDTFGIEDLCPFLLDDDEKLCNEEWCKLVNTKIFRYVKQNGVIGLEGSKVVEKIHKKYVKKFYKGDMTEEEVNKSFFINNHRGKRYVFKRGLDGTCYGDILNDLHVPVQPHSNKKYVDDVGDLMVELILNNPKINGEDGNWSIGFMGSVWIDMTAYSGRKYRIAWYNREDPKDDKTGTKKYTRKSFSPCAQFLYQGDWSDEEDEESSDEEDDKLEQLRKLGFTCINMNEMSGDEEKKIEELKNDGYRCVDLDAESDEGLNELDKLVKAYTKSHLKKNKSSDDESSDDENFYDVQETEPK